MTSYVHIRTASEETPVGAKRLRVDLVDGEEPHYEYVMWLVIGTKMNNHLYSISGSLPAQHHPEKEQELLESLWDCLKKLARVKED